MNTPATLLLRTPTGEDEYGGETSEPEEVEVLCEIQKQIRRAAEEPGDQGELSDTLWNGYFPNDRAAELRTGDSVRVEALGSFELVGDPWLARNPRTQAVSHVEASLRRTAGSEDAS
jgi:hypothetical protein